jgi:RHS repeat-associated protein
LNRPRGDSFVGNGIDTGAGAFVLSRQILAVTGGRTLDLTIRYNSLLADRAGGLGMGWTHAYEASIEGEPQSTVTVYWNRGQRNSFRFVQTGQPYEPLDEAVRYDRLVRNTNGTWTLTRLDGTIYEFRSDGRLSRLGNKIFQFVELGYDSANRLTSIREPVANRSLFVENERDGTGRIQSITDAADRLVFFRYDSAGRLAVVRNPVTMGPVQGESFSSKPIPDNSATGLTHNITVTRREPIGLVRVQFGNIGHSRPSDVRVALVSPQGTRVTLRNPVASGSDLNFDGMVLDDFEGEDPSGTWRVIVTDTQPGNTGNLNVWRLVFTDPTEPTYYLYDGGGRLAEARGPDGERLFANQYDSEGRVVAQDDGLDTNLLAMVAYRERDGGLVTTYTDRMAANWVYEYDGRHRLLSITDPLENVTRFTYNENGDRTRITDALGHSTAYQFDNEGNLIAVVDALQNVTTMTYDSRHNLLSLRDALGNTSQFQYDNQNNLTRATDAKDNSDRKIFGGSSQMTGNLLQDGAGINMTYVSGMRATTSHPVSGTARNFYDNIGRLTRAVDTGGIETRYEFDPNSRVVRERNELGFESVTSYDRRGRIFRTVDRRGFATFNYYDNNDNLIRIEDSQGNASRFGYDGENRLTRTIDPEGKVSSTSYDAAGRLVSETNAAGISVTYEYDAVGRQVAIRDSEDIPIVQYEYNALGQKISETDPLGNTVRYTYDAAGQVVRVRDAEGRETRWSYDELGRRITTVDALNRTARQRYLQDDVLAGIENQRREESTIGYDPANRITSIVTSRNRRTSYQYNSRDQVTRETTPGGTVYSYTYDQVGRRATRAVSGGGQTLPTIHYAYDENDNTVRVSRQMGSGTPAIRLRRTFDSVNRITSYQDSAGDTIQYTYTPAGKLATLTYRGRRVSYSYDDANRLIEVRDWDNRSTRYRYDGRGQLIRVDLPNGTFRTITYDEASRVVAQRDLTPQGAVIVEYRFEYDANGMLISRRVGPAPGGPLPGSAAMTYDNDNRMVSFNGTAITNDQNGNMTRGPLGTGFGDFRYDPMNRLISAGSVSYVYDEEDRLIQFTSNAGTTNLLVDPANGMSRIVAKFESGVSTYYVYGLGLLYEETNGQIRVNHYDHIGNTVAFTGPTGAVTGRIEYSAFGEVVSRSGDTDSVFQFGGQLAVMTDPAGLNYMRFRWYSPRARRFLSEDARLGDIENPASLNRYAYGFNNPVNMVDPNGEFGFIGALVAVGAQLLVRGIERAATGRPFVERGEEWGFVGELAGAAVAGGLTGGAAVGSSLLRAAAVGAGKAALAGAAGNLVKQGVRIAGNAASGNEDVDFSVGDFAADVALSGVFGAFPAGKGAKALQKRFGQVVQSIPTPSGVVKVPVVVSTFGKFKAGLADFVLNVAQGGAGIPFSSWLSSVVDPEPPEDDTLVAPDHEYTRASARQSLYAGRKGVYGEHAHWKFYLASLERAARPLPNNPTPALASF